MAAAYPPTPTLLAGLVPGGTLGLSVVASLFAACTLHLVWEQFLHRGFSAVLIGCLLLPLFAVPAVAYAASQSVAGIALLSLLAVAMHGFVRFTVHRDTEAGFVTGLALAAAFTVDPIAIFYALALGTATWFIAHERFQPETSRTRATVAVVVFPDGVRGGELDVPGVALLGTVFGTIAADPAVLAFRAGVWPTLGTAAVTVVYALVRVPLFVAVGLMALASPMALVGYLTTVPASVVAVWIGLRYTPVTAYVLFTLVALLSVPRDTSRRTRVVIAAVALMQLVLAWVSPTSPGFTDWLAAVTPSDVGPRRPPSTS